MQLRAFPLSSAVWNVPVPRGYIQWAWTIAGVLIALDVAWCAEAGLTIRSAGLSAAATAVLLALSVAYRHRIRCLAEIAGVAATWFALTACIVVLSYLCATSRQPLHDPIFFDLDRRLGFDWWAWRGFVVDRPLLNATFCAPYASLGPQVLLSIFYLPAIGRTSQASELLLLYAITAIVCCVASALWPAIGHPVGFSYDPDFMILRKPGPWQFNLPTMQGIVTMPSYHTTLALLLTYACRNTGVVGWSVGALNVVMLLSIPPIGGHYLADVLAGAAVAGLTISVIRGARSWYGVDRIAIRWRDAEASWPIIRSDRCATNYFLTSTSVEQTVELEPANAAIPSNSRGHLTMLEYARKLLALRMDERGVTAMEYGLIAALIAVVIIGAVTAVGGAVSQVFQSIAAAL
jgi:Flp pilus assembly pilin Flp